MPIRLAGISKHIGVSDGVKIHLYTKEVCLEIMQVYSSGQEKIWSFSVSLAGSTTFPGSGAIGKRMQLRRAEGAAARPKVVVGLAENSYFNVV